MAMAGRVKQGLLRLGDLSLVATAVGCGYVGYNWNANEDADAKRERINHEQYVARLRRVEEGVFQLARQYDVNVDELTKKRDQLYQIRKEVQTLSAKALQHNKEINRDIQKLQKLLIAREELQKQATSLRQQKRTLDAEVKELSKLVKFKEGLKARSKGTSSAASSAEDELQTLSSKVQERNKVLELEIEELMRLVKVKEELQAKSDALDLPVMTHLHDPMLKKDDSV